MPKAITTADKCRSEPFPLARAGKGKQKEQLTVQIEPASLTVLLEWFEKEGIWISDKLKVEDLGESLGWGVVAKETGVPMEVVCRIPRSAILSVHSSLFHNLIPTKTWRQIPLILQLTLSLLYEFRQGKSSRWYGYLQSLPREPIPILPLWGHLFGEDGQTGLGILKGTEVDREFRRMQREERSNSEIMTYWRATSQHFPITSTAPAPPTFTETMRSYAIVTSRAFQVDVYHGAALVPLADLFNHREDNHVCFESDDFVCDNCGSLATCEHDLIVDERPVDPEEPQSETIKVAERLAHLHPQVIQSYMDSSRNTLDLTVKTPFATGEEVYNTYGDNIGWAKMLNEWGFMDETGDALGKGIMWDLREVLDPDLEDCEPRRKLWKSLCALDPPDMNQAGSTLICDLEQEEVPRDSLYVNGDGQLSAPLFWASFAAGIRKEQLDSKSRKELVEIAKRSRQSFADVEIEKRSWSDLNEDEKTHIQHLSQLIKKRKDRLWKSGSDLAELFDALEVSRLQSPLQHSAIKLVVEERRILEVILHTLADMEER